MGCKKRTDKLFPVGQYSDDFNRATGQSLPVGTIYQSSGLAAHIQKRHPSEIGNLAYVPQIIACPDYIGKNPKEHNSIELVKLLQGNVMVCVKLDQTEGYYYVASVFEISDAKLKNRLSSGRLKKI